MKKEKNVVIIIVFAVLAILVLLYFIFFSSDEKRYQWYESYRANSDQPYGTLIIKTLLEKYRPGGKFTFNDRTPLRVLLDSTRNDGHSSYVFIGQSMFLDDNDIVALRRFIETGGDAFIASLTPPENLLNSVFFKECDAPIGFNENEVDSVNMNFLHDTLRTESGYKYAFRFESKDQPYSWTYINDSVFCDATSTIVPLAVQSPERVNFIRIAAGKGNLYLHCNPLVFTNYFLTQKEKLNYASGVFTHLRGNNMIWDEYSKIPMRGNRNAYNSPLYYILQQPGLKYAWWLLLFTVVLYIFFAAKRRQRVIPVLEPKTNTSLEFVNLISTLYYQNGNHLDMARKKMKYFLYFVRSKYGIHAEGLDVQQIRKLSEKSKVNEVEVQSIFDQYHLIEERFKQSIEANRLINLYNAIENFYNHCK